jgi:hypothetical protein
VELGEFDCARLECSGRSILVDSSNNDDVIGAKLTNIEFESDHVILRFDDLSGYRSGYGALIIPASGFIKIRRIGVLPVDCSASFLFSMVDRTVVGCCLSSRFILFALEDALGRKDAIKFMWGPSV